MKVGQRSLDLVTRGLAYKRQYHRICTE